MRLLFGFLCCFYFLHANLSKENVQISTSKDTLQITLPTQVKITPTQTPKEILFVIEETWSGKDFEQLLSYPFSSLKIQAKDKQTLLSLQTQAQTSFSYSKDTKGLKISFWINSTLSWWRYGLVIAIMLVLIILLLYIKKRQNISPSNRFKMTQSYLNKDCKIITLDNGEKIFTIFSNEKGCILLDTKDCHKDFTLKGD